MKKRIEHDCKTRERKKGRANGKTAQRERRGVGKLGLPKEML